MHLHAYSCTSCHLRSFKIDHRPSHRGRRFDPALFFDTAAKGRTIAKHRKSEIIFSQGDHANAVFYIKKGKVKITVVSKQGKEAVVAILGSDQFVGEGCLIGQPKRLATASAMSECVTMRVDKSEIQRLLRDEPTFSQIFVSHVLARTARVEEDLIDQLFNSTEKRLARLLLLLANFGKDYNAVAGKPFHRAQRLRSAKSRHRLHKPRLG
jgi:CRP/FNR family cyclic AMP-dependent transcriptional regulator